MPKIRCRSNGPAASLASWYRDCARPHPCTHAAGVCAGPRHAPKWSLEAVAGEGGAGADGSRVCALRTLPTTAARWSYTLPPVASLVFCAQSPLHAVSLAGRWRMRKPPTSAPRTALQRGGRLSHALERSSQRYRSTAGERGDACCPPAGRQSPPHWTCPSSSRAKWSETRPPTLRELVNDCVAGAVDIRGRGCWQHSVLRPLSGFTLPAGRLAARELSLPS